MRTPMQRRHAAKVAHRRRASRESNLPCSIYTTFKIRKTSKSQKWRKK